MVDRISGLPDEILVTIVSLLSLKEAVKSSVISRRWKHVWKYTRCLNFHFPEPFLPSIKKTNDFEADKSRFIAWVNQIMDSHKSPTIDEFTLDFPLLNCSKEDIDRWLNIAFLKKVERLDLRFPHLLISSPKHKDFYHISKDIRVTKESFQALRSCSLYNVHISEYAIQLLLSSSPLERLSVCASYLLTNLRIIGPLFLKYLEITHCSTLKRIEIDSAPSLASFLYHGPEVTVSLVNVPLLVELSIGHIAFPAPDLLPWFIHQFSKCFCQLEILKFHGCLLRNIQLGEVPKLRMLKQLELNFLVHDFVPLQICTLLIEASPYLRKFMLQLHHPPRDSGSNQSQSDQFGSSTNIVSNSAVDKAESKIRKSPHWHIKMVEIIGFAGMSIDTELVEYLIENVMLLEQITINTCAHYVVGTPDEHLDTNQRRIARQRARAFEVKLRPGTKFVLL